ncbi:MAG: mannonate dehydratase [Balneolales bacterium]|nr:mannonate dehydratase [Balneolales bacterium]
MSMGLTQSWRWYGPNDIVSLDNIEQTGATGIVHALHHIPTGEVWEISEIEKRKKAIEWNSEINSRRNLKWIVVESLNVHEHIRQGKEDRDEWIQKYLQSLENLSEAGIQIVCYNFMPLLDWTRTDLKFRLDNGALALRYDASALAAFDLFILEREGADSEYSESMKNKGKSFFEALSVAQRDELTHTVLQGLPGTGKVLTLHEFKKRLTEYADINREHLKANLRYFLQSVIPHAEEYGVRMCCHPDDPPFPLFGMPRIVSTSEDIEFLVNCVDSPSNGITFCSGSLAPNSDNHLPEIIEKLGGKIHFVHLRNIQREENGSFHESDHLDGSVDMHELMTKLVMESEKRKAEERSDWSIPYRPDHGHQLLDDLTKEIPFHGYSAIGRMKGLAELRGLELGIRKTLGI